MKFTVLDLYCMAMANMLPGQLGPHLVNVIICYRHS